MQRRLVLSLLSKLCSAIAIVGLLAALHAPASAQITVGGAFPPTNMTALGWTSQTSSTCVTGGYNFTFSFLGATDAVRPNPASSVFTANFTETADPEVSGLNVNGTSVNDVGIDPPGGIITSSAQVSDSDPLIAGFDLYSLANAGFLPDTPGATAATSCSGDAFFVYKVATNAPNGSYNIYFGKGVLLFALAQDYSATADASNTGEICTATYSGPPGFNQAMVDYAGGLELVATSSQKITVVSGVGYCWTHLSYSISGSSASNWTFPNGPGEVGYAHATADQQVRPLQVTIPPK